MSDSRFADTARRLAGFAGVAFGWRPDDFWRATPAELATLAEAMAGEDDAVPPDARWIEDMRRAHPDG